MMIKLRQLTERSDAHGTKEGKVVYGKIMDIVSQNPSVEIFNISLEGMVMTDASFPRESVISVAKQYRDERKCFFISGTENRDLLDNWHYAALIREQPLVFWKSDGYEILGPEASTGVKDIVRVVMEREEVTAAEVSDALDMSVPNASGKLKKLAAQGYIIRSERTAESGGIEFAYRSIR